jgi:Protein of unknown function (DUF4232)
MRTAPFFALTPLLLVAACGGSGHSATVTSTPPTTSSTAPSSSAPPVTVTSTLTTAPPSSTTPSSSASSQPGMCHTAGLSVHLGAGQGTAGHTVEPIVFTNTTTTTCTLFGYPGVSFVAPNTGHQVGKAATRNPQHAPMTVTLAPNASASALLQITDEGNYSPSSCQKTAVSGLRVYPPNNTSAAYVPFSSPTTACSTQVNQLQVEATVLGTTGQ